MLKIFSSSIAAIFPMLLCAQDICNTIETISCGDTAQAVIDPGVGEWYFYPVSGVGFLTGKEKIYSFTPTQSGVYDLNVTTATESGVQYLIKDASGGCSMYGWQPALYCYYAPALGSLGFLEAGIEYYILLEVSQEYSGAEHWFTIHCTENIDPCSAIEEINCGDTAEVILTQGSGVLELTNCFFEPIQSQGREKLFVYTASSSGRSALQVLTSNGNFTNYYYAPAAGDCQNAEWTCLGGVNYTTGMTTTAPFDVTEGQSYYILSSAANILGCDQTFRIICPEPWDPCTQPVTVVECGNDIDVTIPPGFGAYDTVGQYCHPMVNAYNSFGRELLYSFTPPADGMYSLQVMSQDGSDITYTFREASTCNQNGWQCIGNTMYTSTMSVSEPLQAGLTYYIMLDAGQYGGAHHLFSISCTTPEDPCISITTVNCDTAFEVEMVDSHGMYDLIVPTAMFETNGGEKVVSFTPEVTGTHLLQTWGHIGSPSAVFIREASQGCSVSGWTPVCYMFGGNATNTISNTLIAGTTYYLLFDCASYGYTEFVTDSVKILCPQQAYDPCSMITPIFSCADTTETIHASGIGLWAPFPVNAYPYYGAAGKENIFSFTAPATGKYSITGHSSTGNVNYAVRAANISCTSPDWTNVGLVETWTLHQAMLIPFELQEGQTYHILADAQDTTGTQQTFTIDCYTAVDPCDSIISIEGCPDYVNATYPDGPGMYSFACSAWPFPGGGELIFSYTAQATGWLLFQGSQTGGFNLYIKPASLGCGSEDWQCVHQEMTQIFYFASSIEVTEGETYYLLFQSLYDQNNYGQLSFNISCSANCLIYADADGDGYGDPSASYTFCGFLQDGYSANDNDCNDGEAWISPSSAELCNGMDDDCDGQIDEEDDGDNDGFTPCGGDCNDNLSSIYPGAAELCNNEDDNCDGQVDEGYDIDLDGYTPCAGDCDESSSGVNPEAVEICNGIDDNCNTLVDEGFDVDADGYSTCNGDCNDDDLTVNPLAEEICWNGLDENCNGVSDEGCAESVGEAGEIDSNSMALFPNPSHESTRLMVVSSVSDIAQVEIISMTGHLVRTLQINLAPGVNSFLIDTKSIADGIYMVTLLSGSQSHAVRLLVRHDE